MARLLCYTPTYADALNERTVQSIVGQVTPHTLVYEIGRVNPYPVPDVRNVTAQYQWARALALAGEYDALITVEHDMDLPPHAIDTLWNDGADVVYGTYMFRHGWPLVVNALQYINGRNIGQSLTLHPDEHQQAKQAGRWRVSGVGLGCTLIRRSVLEQIDFEPDNDGQACDMPFARACVKAGIEQYARFDVACGHATRQGMIYA